MINKRNINKISLLSLLLLFLISLAFPISILLEYQEIEEIKSQSELEFASFRTVKGSHPELNPDESMMDLSFGVPSRYTLQSQYGKFKLKIFTIDVTFGAIPPFRVVSTDPENGYKDWGIINAINLTYVVFIINEDNVIIKFQDNIYFDNQSNGRSFSKEINWMPSYQGAEDPFSVSSNSKYSIKYFSVLRTFHYDNRTVSGAVSFGDVNWDGYIATLNYAKIDIFSNIVVIWSNKNAVANSFMITIGFAILILVSWKFFKRKISNNQI